MGQDLGRSACWPLGAGDKPVAPMWPVGRRKAVPELQASRQGRRHLSTFRLWGTELPTASPGVAARGGVGAPEMGSGKGALSGVCGGSSLQALAGASFSGFDPGDLSLRCGCGQQRG